MSLLDEKVKQFRELLDQTVEQFLSQFGEAVVKAGSQSIATDAQLRKIFVGTVEMGMKCHIPPEKVGDAIWDPRNTANSAHISKLIWKTSTADKPFFPETHQWVKDALVQVCQDTPENVIEVRREITAIKLREAESLRQAKLSGGNQGLPGSS